MFLRHLFVKAFRFGLELNLRFWVNIAVRMGKPVVIWDFLSRIYQQKSSNLCQYRLTPKYSSAFSESEISTKTDCSELAIIIQGPVDNEYDFTLETVKIYKKLFPGAYIIISSWKGMEEPIAKEFEALGCEVLLSEVPKPMGYFHLNYQVLSTMVGLKKAKELGAKYCLKNRSDLRINKPQAFGFMKSLLDIFKLKGDEIPLIGRIVTLNGYMGQMFYPFWVQDYLYFGYTDDLINLFDIPMDERDTPNSLSFFTGENRVKNGMEFCETISPEMYITLHFVKKYIQVDKMTIEQTWDIIRKYFIIMDFENLNIIWKKHNRYSLNEIMLESDGNTMYTDPYRIFTFSDFVNLYTGEMPYKPEYEVMRKKMIFK